MSELWPSMLINGAVVILLWGLLWNLSHQRIGTLEAGLEKKVPHDFCRAQHEGIREDVREIRQGQEKMARTLEEIKMQLARENGRREAEERLET